MSESGPQSSLFGSSLAYGTVGEGLAAADVDVPAVTGALSTEFGMPVRTAARRTAGRRLRASLLGVWRGILMLRQLRRRVDLRERVTRMDLKERVTRMGVRREQGAEAFVRGCGGLYVFWRRG